MLIRLMIRNNRSDSVIHFEVQSIVGGMLRWHPMVTADLHGYTSTFYMAPAARPVNKNISAWPVKWGEAIGRGRQRSGIALASITAFPSNDVSKNFTSIACVAAAGWRTHKGG